MGASYGDTPQGRVRSAERSFAKGEISYNEMRNRVVAEGYTPGKAADVRNDYANARGPKEQPKRKGKKK